MSDKTDELRSRLIGLYEKYPRQYVVIARGDDAELLFRSKVVTGKDPDYLLITKSGLSAVFSYTKLPISVNQHTRGLSGRFYDGTKTRLIHRDNAYPFLDINGGEHAVVDVLDKVEEIMDQLVFGDEEERSYFEAIAQRTLARFGDFGDLYDQNDIIPEFTDAMNVVQLSKGCVNNCLYCTEPRRGQGLVLYSRDKVDNNMRVARRKELKHHEHHLDRMNELFLNSADILWFHIARKAIAKSEGLIDGGLSPLEQKMLDRTKIEDLDGTIYLLQDASLDMIPDSVEIAKKALDVFLEVTKLYVFMGTTPILETEEDYLRELHRYINRDLVGWESAHYQTSRILGKDETPEMKKEAVRKLQGTGCQKVKIIVQYDGLGNGFYDTDGQLYSTMQGLDETAKHAANVLRIPPERYTDQVLLSRTKVLPDTPLYHLHQSGRILPRDSANAAENERKYFARKLFEYSNGRIDLTSGLQDNYEVAVQENRNP